MMNAGGDWDFEGANTQYLTHNFHPFAARFIPQIPSKLIQGYSRIGERILDPFTGCGTTLVECKLNGRDGVGVDVNPLFTLISRVKTTPLSQKELERISSWRDNLVQKAASFCGQSILSDFSSKELTATLPNWKRIDHWFSKTAQKELAAIKSQINTFDNQRSKEFLLTCLSSIIVRVSYQDSETRYAQKIRPVNSFSVFNAFFQKLSGMMERMKSFSKVCSDSKIEVFTSDARRLDFLEDESFHLVVTSPPYMNAYDYHKYHRQRMLWLEIDPLPVRRAEIGGHDTYTKVGADPETYFNDMRASMKEMFRLLKSGRHCFILIGNSVVNGEKIQSQQRLQEIGRDIGFVDVHMVERKVDKSRKSFVCGARLEQEHIVCLKKP